MGTSLLYVAGMFLNDAFDANFDRQHRSTRPIPSGAISAKEVWTWGIGLLVAGLISLAWMSNLTAVLALILAVSILVYDAFHKLVGLAPLVMGFCRGMVYVVAASVAVNGITGWAAWAGCALALYVIGLSFLARKEALWAPVAVWPAILLIAPPGLALLVNDTMLRNRAVLLVAIVVFWIVGSLRYTFARAQPQVGKTVAKLLAGIVLIDLLAALDLSQPWIFLFPIWFALALVLQRIAPAT
jgi:hypothetical protein